MAFFCSGVSDGCHACGSGYDSEEVARRAAQLGLDKPVYVQYFGWLGELLRGNLGFSYRTSQSVVTMIGQRLGPTLLLTFTSLLIAYLIAIP
jgi:peptide/nickel transport system permease protein